MALISAEQLLQQLGANPDLAGAASEGVDGAISRATLLLESQLRTCLSLQDVTDQFVIEPHTPCRLRGMVRFLLSNGALRGAPVVSQASQFTGPYEAIDAEDVHADLKKGLVQVSDEVLVEKYVRIVYSSGFTKDDANLPEELVQAMFSLTPMLLLSSGSAVSGESEPPKSMTKYRSLYTMAEDMTVPYHRRNIGGVALPVYSTVSTLA